MAGGRIDLDVNVAGEIVVLTWHERDALLEELAFAEGMKAIRERFEAIGETQTVELDAEQRSQLRTALDNWGSDRLQPEGIARLHAALVRAEPEQ